MARVTDPFCTYFCLIYSLFQTPLIEWYVRTQNIWLFSSQELLCEAQVNQTTIIWFALYYIKVSWEISLFGDPKHPKAIFRSKFVHASFANSPSPQFYLIVSKLEMFHTAGLYLWYFIEIKILPVNTLGSSILDLFVEIFLLVERLLTQFIQVTMIWCGRRPQYIRYWKNEYEQYFFADWVD